MSSNPPPKGRNYPFAQRGSAFWEKCHVTYDQAVDMFYDQTAMQQYLGHDPIVYSTVYKRVKYPSIFDAQKAYSQDQNSLYQKKEQEQLELEAKGFEEFKKKNDAIRGRLNPTENGTADPLGRPLKPMGDLSKGTFDQGTIENAHEPSDRIETKTSQAPSPQQATESAKNDSEDELILKSSLKQSKPLNDLAAGKFNALKKGSIETEEIKKVQQALIDCGFNLGKFGADGDFGRATEGAVKQFQAHYKPTHTTHKSYQFGNVDGIVDKNTILALDEALVDNWVYDVRKYKLSSAGLSLLKEIETLRLLPYDDQTGKVISAHVEGATIGYGYLIPLNEWELYKDGIKEKEAESLFMQKLPPFEKNVQEKLTVIVTQQQFDALVLLCYNIGAGNFNTSSVLKLVNGGIAPTYGNDIDKAWLAWNKSQGKVMQGLINRRKCELDIYHNGVYKKW